MVKLAYVCYTTYMMNKINPKLDGLQLYAIAGLAAIKM